MWVNHVSVEESLLKLGRLKTSGDVGKVVVARVLKVHEGSIGQCGSSRGQGLGHSEKIETGKVRYCVGTAHEILHRCTDVGGDL